MFNPFTYLRRKTAESVALGISDALQAVTPEGEESPPDLVSLRQLVAGPITPKALAPAPEVSTERQKAGKAKV